MSDANNNSDAQGIAAKAKKAASSPLAKAIAIAAVSGAAGAAGGYYYAKHKGLAKPLCLPSPEKA